MEAIFPNGFRTPFLSNYINNMNEEIKMGKDDFETLIELKTSNDFVLKQIKSMEDAVRRIESHVQHLEIGISYQKLQEKEIMKEHDSIKNSWFKKNWYYILISVSIVGAFIEYFYSKIVN